MAPADDDGYVPSALDGRSSAPWGHKVTAHIYIEGPPTQEKLDQIMGALHDEVAGTDFIGLDVVDVQDQPLDQGAV